MATNIFGTDSKKEEKKITNSIFANPSVPNNVNPSGSGGGGGNGQVILSLFDVKPTGLPIQQVIDKHVITLFGPEPKKAPVLTVPVLFDNSRNAEMVQPAAKVLFKDAVIRTRIPCTIEDLRKIDATLTQDQYSKSLDLIVTTNIDNIDNKQIVYWGADVQKKYAELLESNFELYQSKEINVAKGYISDIIVILTTLSVEEKKASFFDIFKKKDDFKGQYKALKSKIIKLEATLPSLLDLESKISAADGKETLFQKELDCLILAANFLVAYLKDNPITGMFLNRVNSLLTTKTAIISNDTQRKAFSDSLILLVENIQDTLRVEIPLWYENCLAYFSIQATNDINKKSELLALLSVQQSRIIEKLKK